MAGWLGKKNKSVIISWLISYLSILLIPIMISGIVYAQSVRIVQDQVLRINDAMIRQLQQTVDEQVKSLETISLQISTNTQLLSLLNNQKPGGQTISFEYSEKIKQLFREFTVYTLSNRFIDHFFVFLHESETVLTPSDYFTARDYYDLYFRSDGKTYEEWLARMKRNYYSEYGLEQFSPKDSVRREQIALFRTIPLQSEQARATLVMYASRTELTKLVGSVNWADQDMFFIMNKNNDLLFATKEVQLPSLLHDEHMGDSGVIFTELEERKVAASYIRSAAADWAYISMTETSLFNERVEYIRRLTLICLALCVVVGGVVAFWFTKKNYNPLQQLIRSIASNAGLPHETVQNEYRFLNEAFSNTLRDKQLFEKKLEQQHAAMRASFLSRLIKGRLGQTLPAAEALHSYGIVFDGPYYGVILFYVDDYSRLMVHGSDEENLRLAQFIIHNIAEEVFAGPGCRGYVAEVDDLMVCLVNLQGEDHQEMNSLIEAGMNQLQQLLSSKFQVYMTSAVSRLHQTIAGIQEAYNEALEAMDYKLIKGKGGIIRFDDISQVSASPAGSYGYTLAVEQILINCIKSGDYGQGKGIIDRIVADNLADGRMSVPLAKCLMFDLVSTMIKTLNEISSICEPGFLEQLHPAERLLSCNTIEEMQQEMDSLLHTACGYINERNKGISQAKLRNSILLFIDEHYADANLSLNMIAEHLGVGAKYVSAYFKQSTGEGLNYYVNKVRIREAKQLLSGETHSIGDIAVRVGFANANTLIKAFKRHEGITPGQFREMQLYQGKKAGEEGL